VTITADNATAYSASPNLDVLRSLAVLLVLLDHLCRHFHHDRWAGLNVVDLGTFGVLLFFVHTSLVLMGSMQRSGLTGLQLLKNFYIRRFFRIYPLSVLAVLAAVALHLHADGRGLAISLRPSTLEILSNIFLVQNLTYTDSIIGPLWSLPIEVQMYMVLPALFLWKKRGVVTLALLWVLCGYLGHWQQVVPALAWFTLLLYIPNFLPGVMAFTFRRRQIIPSFLWLPFLVSLPLTYAIMPSRRSGGFLCLLLGLTIPLFKEIRSRPLAAATKYIAQYSYGIYLAHSFCIWYGLTRAHSWLLFAAMMVALPIMLYHGLEQPAIRLGSRIASRYLPQRSPEPAVAAA